MEKIENLISVYEDEIKDLKRKSDCKKNTDKIEIFEQFIEELQDISIDYENMVNFLCLDYNKKVETKN